MSEYRKALVAVDGSDAGANALRQACRLSSAGAWFALTYSGYPNVALHDGSWVSWERSPMFKK